MAGTFTIIVRAEFSGAHQLHGYVGPCARMHGHNWKVEAEVLATALDDIGMGIDFRELKGALSGIIEAVDHRVLNDLKPFQDRNPTAENVAWFFYQELKTALAGRDDADRVQLAAVTIWENDRSSVRYVE